MYRTREVRRSLAATAALVVAAWGTTALPAAAEPNGNGNGNGQSQSGKANKGKANKGGANKGSAAQGKGTQGQGARNPGNGGEAKGDKGKGPKNPGNSGGQGNGAKGPKGPKNPGNGGGNGDPAGNNGTVKITPIGQDDGIPQNNPHVPCGFDIEWYGFDEGADIVSVVTLAMHAPTKDVELTPGGPAEVFVGGDPASGAGTDTGFDGEATYYPTFVGEPHPKQGYHIKLTVNTPGSQGADAKHKVFWVEPCETVPAAEGTESQDDAGDDTGDDTAVEGEQANTDDTTVQGEQANAEEDTEVMGEQANAEDDTEVMGEQANADDVPSAVDAGDEGNPVLDFVRSPLPLLVLGLGALLAAIAFASRRRSSSI